MKKIFLLAISAVMAFGMYAKDIKELVVTTTPPMSCQNCENKIKNNLRFEKGIQNIQTNIPEQKVTITYDADKTDAAKIEKAFTKIGYSVEPINTENTCKASNETPCLQQNSCCGSTCCGNNNNKD